MPLWPWPANNGQAYARWDLYGKVGILGPDGGTVLGQQGTGGGTEDTPTSDISRPPSQASTKSKSSPDVVRKHKTSAGKVQETKPLVSAQPTATPAGSEPFVALFGQPIKTNKPSPDPKKAKDGSGRSSSSSKSSKSGSCSSSRDRVPSPSSNSKEGKMPGLKDGKTPAKENLNKTGGKRPPLPPPSLPTSAASSESKSTNKENKGSTMKRPPSPLTPPPSDSNKEGKKRKSSSSSSSTKKSKEKDKGEKKSEKVKEKEKKKEGHQSSSHSKVPKEQEKEKNVSESNSKGKSTEKESKTSSKKKMVDEPPLKPKFHKETSMDSAKSANDTSKVSKPAPVELRHNSNSSSLDASPDSSISFSSLQISGKRGPLGALMAELDEDDDDELVSPLSSDPPSPPRFSSQDTPTVKVEPMDVSPRREKCEKPKSAKHSKPSKGGGAPVDTELSSRDKLSSSSDSSSSLPNLPVATASESDLNKLVALQRHLMLLTDRDLVQKVVDLIEETRQYSVSSSSFDFDLCALDKETLNKIYLFLGKPEPVTS